MPRAVATAADAHSRRAQIAMNFIVSLYSTWDAASDIRLVFEKDFCSEDRKCASQSVAGQSY